MGDIYILCGLPGSGKSTWAERKIYNDPKCVIVSKDALRAMFKGEYIYDTDLEPLVKRANHSILENAIECGHNVIIDEANIRKSKRQDLIGICQTIYHDCEFNIIWFTEDKNNLKNRMTDPRGYPESKWNEVIEGMRRDFEPPTEDECDNLIKVGVV